MPMSIDADALVDTELDRGIQRDQLERFVVREAAELHGLRGFLIEVRGFFRVVGIDRDDHAAARHERRVVGNRVVGFHLVGPPIGERGGADACSGDFIGDFVAFEDVLERAHLEAEFLGDAQAASGFRLRGSNASGRSACLRALRPVDRDADRGAAESGFSRRRLERLL